MAWRLMWHPDLAEQDSFVGSPISFSSDEGTGDAAQKREVPEAMKPRAIRITGGGWRPKMIEQEAA
ncbi:MAG TPA: hypothetical protein VKQ29_13760 [Aliidongia sp.]|nr:hypothetical protein [Aliidongia sp.]